ncbi:MAG: hypothetical protein KGJ62_15085 [Armatimonadetes bacterium]|nr:hypothetical protein [Armatimonadota bacterium]
MRIQVSALPVMIVDALMTGDGEVEPYAAVEMCTAILGPRILESAAENTADYGLRRKVTQREFMVKRNVGRMRIQVSALPVMIVDALMIGDGEVEPYAAVEMCTAIPGARILESAAENAAAYGLRQNVPQREVVVKRNVGQMRIQVSALPVMTVEGFVTGDGEGEPYAAVEMCTAIPGARILESASENTAASGRRRELMVKHNVGQMRIQVSALPVMMVDALMMGDGEVEPACEVMSPPSGLANGTQTA